MLGDIARRLVPVQVRRIMGFDAKGMYSLVLWVTRRRHGVPPGGTALPYAREQSSPLLIFLFVLVVETVVFDLLLRGIGAPEWLRLPVLAVDLYSIAAVIAIAAGCVTRPHVVTPDELRVRYSAFFDLRVPRDLVTSARLSVDHNESGMVRLHDTHLSVAVGSRTNIVVELAGPVTVTLPLGRRAEATRIRFFTDTPAAALAALTRHDESQSLR
ncbi:hypothetical protein ABGB17_28815 [Sphaerisporangium sp. B11E5]|uniref:hypothetical protein n=1 Tax=Sphaerisporangium sp. B11E5 TaxID=3153563 RepID=UPI00325D139C